MINKLIKTLDLIKTVGIYQAWSAVYYRLYMHFTTKILNKDFIIKPILEYKMKLPIDAEGLKGIAFPLAVYGVREEDQLLIIREELHPGMRVLDIGGNIGYYALLLGSIVGSEGKVYSFEPSSENFDLLNENIQLNRMEATIETFHAGISDTVGTDTLYLSEQSNSHSFFDTTNYPKYEATSFQPCIEKIDMIDIDTFVEDRAPIHFIRMDIEGFEVMAFRGMRSFIEKSSHEIKILFEVHRSRYDDGKFNMKKELRWLFDAGFIPKTLIAKPLLESKPWGLDPFLKKGYSPDHVIKTDRLERGYYTNISNEDTINYVCSIGCVRALLLTRNSTFKKQRLA
tara:strand:- start:3483 stop:4505 length:1023 start_codon:yes stop_codon:yes gene_type:complete